MDAHEKVLCYIGIFTEHPSFDNDEFARTLSSRGIDMIDAELLIAFVPSAFAHAILAPLGVGLPDSFMVNDLETGDSARGQLAEEPIFVAARAIAQNMLSASDTKERAAQIAVSSAEMQVARDLSPSMSGMRHVVLIEPSLLRVPVGYVKSKARGRRWKFWS